MADSDISFVLDLDGNEFAQGINEAKNKVEELIAVTKNVGIAAGAVAVAFLAVKASIDLTIEAESIKAINDQFERLTQNAGIATDTLKSGLMDAASGLIDDTDLMKAANRSIIEMGSSAADLPELLNVARLATSAFGGDLLNNFESINHAIATGSVRGLKNLGIIVDQEKALRQFANSHGITVSAMSEAEKKQALLNAVLEKGKTAFAAIDPEAQRASNAWQRIKVSFGQVAETLTLAFDRIAGKSVKDAMENTAKVAEQTKNAVTAAFGDGAEKAAAQSKILQTEITSLTNRLEALKAGKGGAIEFDPGLKAAEIAALNTQLEDSKLKLSLIQEEQRKINSLAGSQATKPTKTGESPEDKDKLLAAEAKFNQDLAQLTQQRIASEMAAAQSLEQMEFALGEKRISIRDQADAQIEQIKSQRRMGEIANDEQMNLLIEQVEANKAARLIQFEEEVKQARLKALDQYVNASTSASDGIARAFEAGSKKNQIALNDWGATGMRVFNSFGNQATSALQAWGAGTKSAADAAKGFIFGMIADEAEARGKVMLLASIWPPNPAGLAAGAGLIALSGFLRAQSGGAGTGVGGSAGQVSVAGVTPPAMGTEETNYRPDMAQAREQKSVSLQIMGNYFETEQTKTRLVEMIREASDATDFKITEIGG